MEQITSSTATTVTSFVSSVPYLNTTTDYVFNDSNVTVLTNNIITNKSQVHSMIVTYKKIVLARKVLDWFNLYYLGFIIVVGVLGNGKNVVTFFLSKKKLCSPSYYLTAIALNDVIFLLILFILWLNQFEINLFTHAGLYQLHFFLSSTSTCISAWLVAAFTFERFVVVRYPLKRTKMCTVGRAKRIITWLTVVALVIQAIALFTSGAMEETSTAKKHTAKSVKALWQTDPWLYIYYQACNIFNLFEAFITLVVPSIVIVVMNGYIIHGLSQFNKTFKTGAIRKHQSNQSTYRQDDIPVPMKATRVVTSRKGIPLQLEEQKRFSTILEDDKEKDPGVAVTCDASQDEVQIIASQESSEWSCGGKSGGKYVIASVVLEEQPRRAFFLLTSETQSLIPSSSMENDQLMLPRNCDSSVMLKAEPLADGSGTIGNNEPGDPLGEICNNNNDGHVISEAEIVDVNHTEAVGGAITPHRSHSPSDAPVHANMNDIETDASQLPRGQEEDDIIEHSNTNSATGTDISKLKRRKINKFLKRRNGMKVKSCRNNKAEEYAVTKKLVLISIIHILFNLPSYAMNLKLFIDDNVTLTSFNKIDSKITWLVQQYLLLFYYTNFSINFLLYSTSSSTFRHQRFWCKKKSASSQP